MQQLNYQIKDIKVEQRRITKVSQQLQEYIMLRMQNFRPKKIKNYNVGFVINKRNIVGTQYFCLAKRLDNLEVL